MAYMEPTYEMGDFVRMADGRGESSIIPAEYRADAESDGAVLEESYRGKWFCQLSAAGYMDQTGWDGPFDTEEEARAHIRDAFDVDPDTGEDLGEEDADSDFSDDGGAEDPHDGEDAAHELDR